MIVDPELQAMSDVYSALSQLDESTRNRVVEWVLNKLSTELSLSVSGKKRGPKPGSKRKGKKRGPKPGTKKKGKRGRPAGSKNRSTNSVHKQKSRRRGRPRKATIEGL